jgi:hypothetical protein
MQQERVLPASCRQIKKARLRRGSGRGKKRPPLDRGACVSHTAQKNLTIGLHGFM